MEELRKKRGLERGLGPPGKLSVHVSRAALIAILAVLWRFLKNYRKLRQEQSEPNPTVCAFRPLSTI